MGTHKNTLTINGKVLDITSGWRRSSQNLSIDGFVKHHAHQTVEPQTAPIVKKPIKSARQHIARSATDVHKRAQHTKTLMRSAVSRPKPTKLTGLSTSVQRTLSAPLVSKPTANFRLRHKRAMIAQKNHLVSKFSSVIPAEKVLVKRAEPVQVKPHPANHNSKRMTASHIGRPAASSVAQVKSPTQDLLDRALMKAIAHESKPLKQHTRRRSTARKIANVLAIVAVVLALGGFIAYQNIPNVEMRLAASKAGIAGQLPSYRPAGFAINRQIKSSPGQVVISFNSTTDSRNFNISQAASDWNSQSLLDSYVALKDQHYQTFNQPSGKTIYIYGNANATWVDGGTWYNVTGNSNLSNDQLLKLADSF